jgi:hypothetical protein
VDRAYRNVILPVSLLTACVALAFTNTSIGDFSTDSVPAIAALDHLHFSAYFAATPAMGPLAILVEAPLALLGHSGLTEYRWASMAGLVAVAGLGWYLCSLALRRGVSVLAATVLALLCVINPITLVALQVGHPEELFTAALAVGAVVLAAEGMSIRAGLLLGIAIASKQWAVIAILPVLMAMSERRAQAVAAAIAVLAVAYLPGLVAAPDSFVKVQGNAASGGGIPSIWSVWFPVSPVEARWLPNLATSVDVHQIPMALRPLTHPLLVATFFLIPAGVAARRRSFSLGAGEALALFALLALIRCALDPVDNLYYHAPLLLALLAWDAVEPVGRLPLRGLCGSAIALLLWRWSEHLGDLDVFNLAYLVVVAAGALLLVAALRRRELPAELDDPFRRTQTPGAAPVTLR